MAVHAFTSFSFSYLNRARVLAASIKRIHPDWVTWAVISDHAPPSFRFELEQEAFDRVLYLEDLFGDQSASWIFGHDVIEACTGVKGRALTYILEQGDCEKVFFFDPDTALFNPMDDVLDTLDTYSIVLTPHQIDPEPPEDVRAIIDNEICSLHYGSFNLGFVGVSNTDEGRRFAKWWDARLTDWCHDRLDIGLFVDQKWCNLVPCYFDSVKILRDPGLNVASWNLSQRTVTFDEKGMARVNGSPLKFFHFTKLGPIGDKMTSRYAKDNVEVYELWHWYKDEVEKSTAPTIPNDWWHFGTFANGKKIKKHIRRLYREAPYLHERYPNPFQASHWAYLPLARYERVRLRWKKVKRSFKQMKRRFRG
ncbi:hypothetical protein OOT33_13430 [Sphingobium sp. DEHP117]|uniref:hypothetical protein n=1 Tax=Sphingobium sp. DEHP117 TaxID=2993436 RepID=UPI0027D6FF21|nr:hypothetical protein [Sphingobium sp. DEHP117]MDQ4421424.1 hypothetical protein [Sphingobium sp. DEHP117]